uniref:Uncharacterized protein n=1 Tax=Arundo donax TaxID=35708 RepID=A0A0A9D808_ARUDO
MATGRAAAAPARTRPPRRTWTATRAVNGGGSGRRGSCWGPGDGEARRTTARTCRLLRRVPPPGRSGWKMLPRWRPCPSRHWH